MIAAKLSAVDAGPHGRNVAGHTGCKKALPGRGHSVARPVQVIKRQFGYSKVAYRKLAKNTAQVLTLFSLSNLGMARRHVLLQKGYLRLLTENTAIWP